MNMDQILQKNAIQLFVPAKRTALLCLYIAIIDFRESPPAVPCKTVSGDRVPATEFRYINYAKFVVNFSRLPRTLSLRMDKRERERDTKSSLTSFIVIKEW